MRSCVYLLLVTLASGCNRDTAGTPKAADAAASRAGFSKDSIRADLTTPDRALKSYWRYRDEVGRSDVARVQQWLASPEHATIAAQRVLVMSGDAREAEEQIEASYRQDLVTREIVEVKAESESRATILARLRNVTPAPAGATLDDWTSKRRRDGTPIRYVLEKDSTGWHIVQAYTTLLDDGQGEWKPRWTPADKYVPTIVSP